MFSFCSSFVFLDVVVHSVQSFIQIVSQAGKQARQSSHSYESVSCWVYLNWKRWRDPKTKKPRCPFISSLTAKCKRSNGWRADNIIFEFIFLNKICWFFFIISYDLNIFSFRVFFQIFRDLWKSGVVEKNQSRRRQWTFYFQWRQFPTEKSKEK